MRVLSERYKKSLSLCLSSFSSLSLPPALPLARPPSLTHSLTPPLLLSQTTHTHMCAQEIGKVVNDWLLTAIGTEGSHTVAHLVHSNHSLCLLKLKNYEGARKEADNTIAAKPNWHKGWARKAAVYDALITTERIRV
jgi:hypothetical protein